jgi:hypothetical protein
MQYAPHGVGLQWQARERVAGDDTAAALLLEKVHGLILVDSVQEASLQVPLLIIAQQCLDVTTDVAIILAEFGGRQLLQPPAGQKVCNLLRNAARSVALLFVTLCDICTASGVQRLEMAPAQCGQRYHHQPPTQMHAYVHRTVQETNRTG